MNLEAMFFPKANINHQFDEIVMGCAELINSYTIESNFDEQRVKRSLIKNKGQVRADLHSAGNIFQFEFYGSSFPQEFKIEFSGETKPFKVVYEIDSSNPSGHITLFAVDGTAVLIKELKEMLSRIADFASEQVDKPTSASSDIPTKEEAKVIIEFKEKADTVESFTKDPAVVIKEKTHCKCPSNNEDINNSEQYLIEHFSDKVTRHFHINGDDQITIYQCKHCDTFIMIESLHERSGKSSSKALYLDAKTANYLLAISEQLSALVQEKGVGVVREIISGSAL